MAKVSITFAAWKEGRVTPGTGQVRLVDADKNAPAVRAAPPEAVRVTLDRATVASNLKQIGIAMHNYESAHAAFPTAAIYSKDGKPLLSWRVALLPYLNQEALYKEFKLDEPWDSPHNKKLVEKMPGVFGLLGVDLKGLTIYHVFTGPGTMFEGTKGVKVSEVTDGLSNTVLVIESGPALPWTQPGGLAYDPKSPLNKLGGVFENGFHILLADGSVRLFSPVAGDAVLRRAIIRNDGVGFDAPPPKAKAK